MMAREYSTCTECNETKSAVVVITSGGREAAELCRFCLRAALGRVDGLLRTLGMPPGCDLCGADRQLWTASVRECCRRRGL